MEIGFIAGMPRSGTTWVSKSLDSHPDIAAIGETMFWGKKYISPKNGVKYSSNEVIKITNNFKMQRLLEHCSSEINQKSPNRTKICIEHITDLANISPSEIFNKICESISINENAKLVIEKTPHHVRYVKEIAKNYPQSKWVLIVRDPYGFVLSYKHRGQKENNVTRTNFDKLYHPITCSLIWRYYYRHCMNAKEILREKAIWVDYIDIKQNGDRKINEILDHFEINSNYTLVNPVDKNSSFKNGCRPELNNTDIFWLRLITAKIANQSGYTIPDRKIEIIGVIKSIMTLPIWIFWVLIWLFSKGPNNKMQYFKNILYISK